MIVELSHEKISEISENAKRFMFFFFALNLKLTQMPAFKILWMQKNDTFIFQNVLEPAISLNFA